MADKPLPLKVGQIWREMDARGARYVRVLEIHPSAVPAPMVTVETVYNADGKWFRAHGTRQNAARVDRFNGKPGGYSLFEPPPEPVTAEPPPNKPSSGGARA